MGQGKGQVFAANTDVWPEEEAGIIDPIDSTDEAEENIPHRPLPFDIDGNAGWLNRFHIRAALTAEALGFRFTRLARAENAAGTLFSLFATLFGLGIILYFSLDFEPLAPIILVSAAGLFVLARKMKFHTRRYYVLMAAVAVLSGMAAAQFRSMTALSPAISGSMTGEVTARIVAMEPRAKGAVRFLLAPQRIEGIAKSDLPQFIRLSARKLPEGAAPGKTLKGLARLGTYSGPAYPGGYDFSFLPRFSGIGGTGLFKGAPKVMETGQQLPVMTRLKNGVETLRMAMASRIRARLAGDKADVAVALITGERSSLDETVQESLRQSGLAHILAISGLHMGLVALTLIWFLRRAFACFPEFAQTHPVKKYAAIAGLAAASFYLVLSGNSVASQRAWVMIAVMLLAMVFDRRALTLRSVAIAAIVILLIAPEQVFSAGFQMSFAAVASLVAVFALWTQYRRSYLAKSGSGSGSGGALGLIGKIFRYALALAATSIIAGLATGIYSAWHFHRIALLGLAANLAAMPVVSFVVMPFALLAVLLMPYGLEGPALQVMGWGIDWVLAVANTVNSYGSDRGTGLIAPAFPVLASIGLVILCVFKTRLRLFGLVPLALAFCFLQPMAMPDILIAENGRVLAFKQVKADEERGGAIESLAYPYPRRGKFIQDIWNRAWPQRPEASDIAGQPLQFETCNKDGCIIDMGKRGIVYLVYAPELLKEACRKADILLAPRLKWVRCRNRGKGKGKGRGKAGNVPQIILKREDFENNGSYALYYPKDGSNWRVSHAITNHTRPWSRPLITWQD